MKLITTTWSHSDNSDIENSLIYKSFIKNNKKSDFINIHFNRYNYLDIEAKFESFYEKQHDYILYKIFLIKKFVEKIDDEILIFSDTNDVVSLRNIYDIPYHNSNIIFSSEKHQYPNDISNWSPINKYSKNNIVLSNFLNSGLIISDKKMFIELLNSVIQNVLPLNYKNFGGDQGVYTYHYIHGFSPQIFLDEKKNIFASTYLTSDCDYRFHERKFQHIPTESYPFFIHDNGWNYGSPKIINKFDLFSL